MFSKAKIFNLALGALLLSREISDPDTDQSNEAKVLNLHYDIAFNSALADMDLDSTADQASLELLQNDPNQLWLHAYKYPVNCVKFRRIFNTVVRDDRNTRIPLVIRRLGTQKAIFTNEPEAIGEFQDNTVNLVNMSAEAGIVIAQRLALLSTSLIVGKGAAKLQETIIARYALLKAEAQEKDKLESFNFLTDEEQSEWVKERTS